MDWSEILLGVVQDGFFACIAAIGFSSISNMPRRGYLACGGIAAVGHALRYVLMNKELVGMHIALASLFASLTIGLLAVLISPRIKCPAEVCFSPALLPMIPGMYAYRSIEATIACMCATEESVFQHYIYLLESNGLTCIFIILALVIGANLPVFALQKLSFRATRPGAYAHQK